MRYLMIVVVALLLNFNLNAHDNKNNYELLLPIEFSVLSDSVDTTKIKSVVDLNIETTYSGKFKMRVYTDSEGVVYFASQVNFIKNPVPLDLIRGLTDYFIGKKYNKHKYANKIITFYVIVPNHQQRE